MTFSEKIDEWLKEAEARPASAVTVLRLVANRLRDLSERNEQLLAENIALQDGSKVLEYQKRITHLEYQLEMLKRRVGDTGQVSDLTTQAEETACLLLYNPFGRIFRFVPEPASSVSLGKITGELAVDGEFPRFLAVPESEEILLLFTSGRVTTLPAASLPVTPAGGEWGWEQASLPAEPRAGEQLACILPLSALPVSAYIVQSSRRGCLKKTMTSVSQSILDNQYLGKGAIQKLDRAFDALLCQKKEHLALVTYEGQALALDVEELSYAAEERIKLGTLDYVVASFILAADQTLLCLTQTGKVIARPADALDRVKSPLARGQSLIPASKLSQGVRFIGAAAVRKGDRLAVLDAEGQITLHDTETLAGSGAVKAGGLVLSMGVVKGQVNKG